MTSALQYIQRVFSDVANIEKSNFHKLPIYLTDKFDFMCFDLYGNAYILAEYKEKQDLFIENIEKDISQIKRLTNRNPVFVFNWLRLTQRENLIKNKISFVVPETQIFIPYPPIYLTETEAREKTATDEFKKSTQVVFAYLFLNNVDNINAHRLAKRLGYSVPTANRALNELVDKGLLIQNSNGTRKKYSIPNKRDYWELGNKYLFNPVSGTYLLLKERVNIGDNRLYKSGDTALSEYSDDFDEDVNHEKHYACHSKVFSEMHNNNYLKSIEFSMRSFVLLESFAYDPALLSKDDKIDPISLYAQYLDKNDERVEMAFDKIIEEIING
jgi:predicted transcriptional regulator